MNFEKLREILSKAMSTSIADSAVRQYLFSHQIRTFSFTYYSYHPKSANKLKYEFVSKNLKVWHENYVAENYDYVDSTLEKVYQSTVPVYWNIEEQLRKAKSNAEKKMRLDSKKFGSEKGLSIPIHGPNNDFAILMVEQLRGENCLENWRELQYELLLVAHYYYGSIKKLLIKSQNGCCKYELSNREMQCLTLMAQKFSLSQISNRLHITERTVNYHIQNINKKLGVKNKYLALAVAIDEKLLTL